MSLHSPSFSVLTWGCQMNEDDSDQMSAILVQMGYSPAQDLREADIILLNTCAVRAKPEHKVKTRLGELRELKLANPDLIIGVCGCMAQRQGAGIRKNFPHVDLVVGTAQIERLPELIGEVSRSRHPLAALDLPRDTTDLPVVPLRADGLQDGKLKAFVPITYGCDNFCAYCIVPYVRGRERSRSLSDVVEEVKRLVDAGCKEVTLLGQNVNSYANPDESGKGFADLLGSVNDIDGLLRIRFMTSHPKDFSDTLIAALAGLDRVCKHVHLPIQSGDDEILSRMRRKYTVEHYMGRVHALRTASPGIAISTDILVGFPGETDEQFRNTLRTMEAIKFDAAFTFAYNAIEKTAAAAMPDQLPPSVKNARLREVIELQNRHTMEINSQLVGGVFEVLVEGRSHKDAAKFTGLTTHGKTINFTSSRATTATTALVKATKAYLYGFAGEETESQTA